MLDAMPLAVAVLNAIRDARGNITEFNYTFSNKAAVAKAGEPLENKRFFLNDDALLFNNIVAVVNSGKTEDFVYHYQADPQKWIHYNIRKFGEGAMLMYECITDRKLASIELHRERQRHAEVEAISHTGSFEWDFIGNKIYWSDEMYRIHGLQPQSETITKDFALSMVHPEDTGRINKKIDCYSRTPGNEEIQYKLRLKDGTIRHMSARFESFRSKSGKITHMSGLVHDITEKRTKADALRDIASNLEKESKGKEKREASLEDFKRIIENSSSAIVSIDKKGAITTWNPAAEKLYGYSAGEAIGRQVASLIVPEPNRADVAAIFEKLFAGETVPDFEATKKCRGGNEVEVSVNLVPQKDTNGKVTGVVITSKDISEAKKAQQEILRMKDQLTQTATDKYHTLFNTIDEGFCIFELIRNKDGKATDFVYREYNESFERLTGFKDAIGKTVREMMSDVEPFWLETYTHVADTGEPVRVDNYVQAVDRWYSIHASRVGGKGSQLIAVLFDDITETKRSAENLREAHEKTTEILESIGDAFYAVDENWKFTYINGKAEKIWGKTREEMLGKYIWDIFTEAIDSHPYKELHRAFEERIDVAFEAFSPVINMWIQVTAFPKKSGGMIVYFRDITQGKQAEETLRQSEENYRLKLEKKISERTRELRETNDFIEKITSTIPDLIQIQDVKTNTLVYTNQDTDFFKRNFGFKTKNPKMTTDYERAEATVHQDDMEKVRAYIEARRKIKGDEIIEVELKMSNGNYVRSRSKAFKTDQDGNPSQILIITTDITEQKKSQQQQMKEKLKLDEQALFIQGIANASADILFVMNLNTKEIVYTNHAVAEKLGYSAKQIKAMKNPVLDIMHEADLPKMLKHIEEMKSAADDEVREIEYRMKHADGSLFWFRDRNTVFKRDEKGVPVEKLGICQDITERKHAEENIRLLNKTLRDKNKELQSVNNEMKTFTSIAAYDYKETLQTLYTNLEYIISRDAKNFSNTGKANLRKAQTAIQKMKLLTDDIVAYSRLQTMDTNPTKVDLNNVIDNALKELNEKVIQTGTTVDKEKLPEITGFPFLLDLMFYHLIDNAVKFRQPNEKPHIKITYNVSKDKHSGTDVHQISIADNGIGLPHEEAQKVFEMFYRVNGNAYRGSGIGLAICKKIADLHGGTMAIESTLGKGTTICCFFPIA